MTCIINQLIRIASVLCPDVSAVDVYVKLLAKLRYASAYITQNHKL